VIDMILQANQTLVFFGDSITDSGRDRSNLTSFGNGYVAGVVERLQDRGIRFINAGLSGDTTRNLLVRLETDVIAHQPDWVSVAIGVNDVWRSFGVGDRQDAVSIGEFEANYRQILERIRASAAKLILVEPFVIEVDKLEPFRAQVDLYSSVVAALAREFDAVFVPFQAMFDCVSGHWSDDRVHPNAAAVDLMANRFLQALEVEL
jgi:lysophospholipase L1-like esterase